MRGRICAAFSFPPFPTYSRHFFLGYAVFSSIVVIRNKAEKPNRISTRSEGLFVTGIDLVAVLSSTTSTVAINDVSRHSHNRSICTRHSFARNNFRRSDVKSFAYAFRFPIDYVLHGKNHFFLFFHSRCMLFMYIYVCF